MRRVRAGLLQRSRGAGEIHAGGAADQPRAARTSARPIGCSESRRRGSNGQTRAAEQCRSQGDCASSRRACRGLWRRPMVALTVPAEFRSIQACYPIVFQKRADTGQFQPLRAVRASRKARTCSWARTGWDANYIPMSVERLPFLIGGQRASEPGSAPQPVIHIDLDSPRVSSTRGRAAVPRVWRHHRLPRAHQLAARSARIRACRPRRPSSRRCWRTNCSSPSCSMSTLKDGSENRLAGFYTINEERLRALDGAAIGELHAQRLPGADVHGDRLDGALA